MIDVFRVGVHIGMTTNSSQLLATMLKTLTDVNVKAKDLEKGLNGIGSAAKGLAQVFVGWEVLKVMDSLVNKGVAFNQELAKMKMANYAPGDITALTDQAYKTMKDVPGSNLTDNLKSGVDIRNISGSAEHSVALNENLAKLNLVLSNVTGKAAEQAGYKFMKFLEDSGRMMDPATGQFSEARVAQQSRWMEGVIAGMNGRVTGDDMFQLRQSGKASVNALSDAGLTNLMPFIQSLGATAVGTALQGSQQQLLGAVQLTKHTIEWLEKYKLLDPDKVHQAKGGKFTLDPGAITNEQTLMHNLPEWIWGTLKANMAGMGLSLPDMLDASRRSGLRSPLLGFIAEALQNEASQRKEIGNVNRAGQVDQYNVMSKESPTFRITEFTTAWENLQIALGKTVDATQFLVPITHALNDLNAFVVANPDFARHFIEFTGAIGGMLVLSGAIKVFNFAIGPFVKGIKLLVAVEGLTTAGAGLTGVSVGLTGLGAALLPFAIGGAAFLAIGALMDQLHTLGGFGNKAGFAPMTGGPAQGAPKSEGTGDSMGGPGSPGFTVPVPPRTTVQVQTQINVDGKTLAKVTSEHQADTATKPPSGTTQPDIRIDPWMLPGNLN